MSLYKGAETHLPFRLSGRDTKTMGEMSFWLIVAVIIGVDNAYGDEVDPLLKCLEDPDYDKLLDIVRDGLPHAKTPRHIVIVGGGVAGLTAAKFLEDAGHKVTIIEANYDIGGRVRTYRDKDEKWYAEFGAMRIPEFHKILLELAKKLNVKLNPFIEENVNTYYFVNNKRLRAYVVKGNPDALGYPVAPHERGHTAAQLFSAALQPIRDDLKSGYTCKQVLKKYDSYTVQEYLIQKGNLSRGALRMIGDILDENGFYYTSLTETLYIQSDISDNNTYVEVTGGFEKLIEALKNTLKCSIFMNSKVNGISHTKTNVTVYFESADRSALENITADYILVTTTARATLLMKFQPPLSPKKMEAQRSVHYSSSTKVVLSFKERFWEKEGIKGGRTITDLPPRFIYYPSHNFTGAGGALLASYTYSDDSDLFEGIEESELVEMMLEYLVEIHGEEIRHLCTGGVVKKWNQDPFSHGAFAIFTPYQYSMYSKALFQNEGRVHFAGEHTAMPHGWIETSMKSALRAAKNINGKRE
ncbi:L-amino-acid oxidase [Brienomyrus brachyistius]|uniref:L-amino-acid oxidase n=1 Tax=Brienomyrus brachyistius TaxID=42636 RepID=UPI0020B2F9C8|nr:L-amino-acid oxidase [Brienomyrus brachyistius]